VLASAAVQHKSARAWVLCRPESQALAARVTHDVELIPQNALNLTPGFPHNPRIDPRRAA